MSEPVIVSSVSWIDLLTFFIAIVLPLLTGFLTSRSWAPAVKGIALAVLALIAGIANELLIAATAGEPFDIGVALLKFGGVFVIAIASYFGILSRPLQSNDSTGKRESIASKVASHGVK